MRSTPESKTTTGMDWPEIIGALAPTYGWVRKEVAEQAQADAKRLMQRPPRWLWSGVRQDDQRTPDGYMLWFVFPIRWSADRIRDELELLGVDCDPHHCQHDYDCCGHFNSDGLHIRGTSSSWWWRMREEGRVPHMAHYQIAYINWNRNV